MKINKTWQLPAPEKTDDGLDWHPVVRIGRVIPFGYRQDENDKDILLPIKGELELLEKAKKYIKQHSYREVANWLSKESGRTISHVGLMKRIKLEQKRKSNASAQSYYAKRYKEALQKTEKLSQERFGRTPNTNLNLQ